MQSGQSTKISTGTWKAIHEISRRVENNLSRSEGAWKVAHYVQYMHAADNSIETGWARDSYFVKNPKGLW